jgi:hypothetical protein
MSDITPSDESFAPYPHRSGRRRMASSILISLRLSDYGAKKGGNILKNEVRTKILDTAAELCT